MTHKEFCFWLQGWFELNETIDHREGATEETLKLIKEKLDLVLSIDYIKNYESDRNPFIQQEIIY